MADDKKTAAEKDPKAAAKALFADVDKINAKLTPMEKQVLEMKRQKSDIIGQIAKLVGKGPFVRGGKTLKIVSRQLTDEDGQKTDEWTHFFRGEGEVETTSMD